MTFSYKMQNGAQVLTYELQPTEQLDQDAFGMLRANEPAHILVPAYSQIDAQRELSFKTGELRCAGPFLAQHVFTRQQFATVLLGVVDAFLETRSYMLADCSFVNSLDCVFLDERLGVKLAYVPVVGYQGAAGALPFLREVRRHLEPNRSEADLSYLQAIDAALGSADDFSLQSFKKLLSSMLLKNGPVISAAQEEESFGRTMVFGITPPGQGGQQPNGLAGVGGASAMGGVQIPPNGAVGFDPAAQGGVSSDGIAIPGAGVVHGEGAGTSKSKGLFGRRKSKDSSEGSKKMTRAEKKAAKAAKKAARAEAKRTQKAEKKGLFGKSKDSSAAKSGGKDFVIPTGPAKDAGGQASFAIPGQASGFAIPGQDGTSAATGSGSAPLVGFGSGSAGSGAISQDFGGSGQADSAGWDGGPSNGSGSGSFGSQGLQSEYVADDFGVTEVYGINNVEQKTDQNAGGAAGAADSFDVVGVAAQLVRQDTGQRYRIDKPTYLIGRRQSAVDLYIPERPKVSRVHAKISYAAGNFRICDNDSLNHTEVNGQMLQQGEWVTLAHGDIVDVGDVRFKFELI